MDMDKNGTFDETVGINTDAATEKEPQADDVTDGTTKRTSLEFEISDESGFVFMSETDASFDEKGGLVFSTEADISTEIKEVYGDGEKTAPTPVAEEEFALPESFEPEEKYTSASFVENPFGISTTYVPRFTDASEKYRVRGSSSYSTESVDMEAEDKLDPTAEIGEDAAVERVIVNSAPTTSSEPTDESIKVYKFVTPIEAESDPVPAPIVEPAPDVEDKVVEEVDEEPAPAPKVLKRPEEYDIPDPEARKTTVEYEDVEEDLSSKADRKNIKREFVSPAQRDAFKDRFLDGLMSVRFRLVAAVLVFVAMISLEVVRLFGVDPLVYIGFDGVSYAGAVIDLMFSLCMLTLALPEIIRAFVSISRRVFAPELLTVVSIAALCGYTALILADESINYLRFGTLFGIQVISIIVAGLCRVKGDFVAFKVVSKNVHKHVLIKKLTRELPRENMALDGAVDEYNSKTARMFRTAFVNDFYAYSSKTVENSFNTLLILGCALGLSAVTGVVSFFLFDNSLSYAAQAFMLVLLITCPSFSVLVHKLPYSCAARFAGREGTAFVGERALYDAADLDVIAYEDTEIFGAEDVSIKKVHLYGKVYNTAKAMQQMYAIFSSVGGPLDAVFSATVDKKGSNATDLVIEEDGISGTVDGHRVAAGSEEYMLRHGIIIPSDDFKTSRTTTDSTRVMYGAEDGEVYVKLFIRYSFTEEFTMILPYLKEQGIVPLIYTRDPNINNELLKTITMGEDVIRVMKKDGGKTTEEKTYRHLSSNVVTLGEKGGVIGIAFLARKYTAFQSSQSIFELISMIVGAALASLVAIGGMIDAAAMGLVGGLALWQIAWCIVLYVRSSIAFRITKNS